MEERRVRAIRFWGTALIAVALGAAALAAPDLAWALPGAGDFTSLESPTGREQAGLYNLLAKICFVIFTLVCAVMFAAIVRFRRKSDDEHPEQLHGNMKVELGLLIAASMLQIYIGYKTINVMWYVEDLPETELTVEAIGYQWGWKFRYPVQNTGSDDRGVVIEETFISDDLVIPAHTNVRLEITSEDVIHSLFIPELGVKMDAVPGRFNYWWVNADGPLNTLQVVRDRGRAGEVSTLAVNGPSDTVRPKASPLIKIFNELTFLPEANQPGWSDSDFEYDLDYRPNGEATLERKVDYLAQSREADDAFVKYEGVEYRGMCTEICGKGHYNMYFRTVALTLPSFYRWIVDRKSGDSGPADGGGIYASKCAVCHGAEGQGVNGPPLIGQGNEWTNEDSDESREKHVNLVLKGMRGEITVNGVTRDWGVMQPWYDQLNDEELAAVVNHERTSWGNAGGTVTPELVAELRAAAGYPLFPAGGAAPVPDGQLMAEGEAIYAACVTCHGPSGRAGKAKIAGSPMVLSNIEAYVNMLILGTSKKSAMGRSMSDREIASIITYTRKSFGNEASAVQPSEIDTIREAIKPKRE